MKKNIIQIALLAVIIVLVYFVINSIMAPVRFNKEKKIREFKVIEKLKDIRTAQLTYKSVYGQYTGDFDTLIDFVNNGELPIVLKKGTVPDSLTTEEALELGLITRDTTMIFVKDSLFKNIENFVIENIQYVPFTDRKVKFTLAAGKIERSSVMVPIFEAMVHNDVILQGLDRQMVRNLNQKLEDIEKYPGLKVGSMIEPSTDGNWE